MHTNSKLLFYSHARHLFRQKSQILEIGPDSFPSSLFRLAGPLGFPVERAYDTLAIAAKK